MIEYNSGLFYVLMNFQSTQHHLNKISKLLPLP